MAKPRVQFICQNCGTAHARWAGKCDACGEWNTLVEEGTSGGIGSGPDNPVWHWQWAKQPCAALAMGRTALRSIGSGPDSPVRHWQWAG